MSSADDPRSGNRAHPGLRAERVTQHVAGLAQVTSELTHQVKNRLQAMMVHVAVLKERLAAAPPEVRRSLDVLEAEINRADLGISRLARAARPVEISMRLVDLNPLLQDLAASMSEEWQGKGVGMVFAPGTGRLSVVADQELLRRAFAEILVDAADAVRGGGVVTMRTARESSRVTVLISADAASAAGQRAPGIEPAAAAGERATVPPLVRRVVEMHGGDVEIASAEGGRTRAVLRFPVDDPGAA